MVRSPVGVLPPPHASRDNPPDCRKRSAFDQLSYIHHKHDTLPRSKRDSEPAIFLAPAKTCKRRDGRIDSAPALR